MSKTSMNRFQFARMNMAGKPLDVVAEESGVSKNTIWKLEHNKVDAGYKVVGKLAEYYGVNVAWLVGQSDSPSLEIDSQTVTRTTGLSAESVEMLQKLKETKLIDCLNTLLESNGFIQMLSEFETARTVNVNSTQTEEQAKLIESLNQWGINNGMESKNNRVSDRQLIDIHLWKASQIIGNTFTEILKGERKDV